MKKLKFILLLTVLWNSSICQTTCLHNEVKNKLDIIILHDIQLDSIIKKIIEASGESDFEKVNAISYWIAKHIRYDNQGLRNGFWHEQIFNETLAKAVLSKKKSICGGYAMLAKVMFDRIGVENEIIIGTAKGRNYNDSNTSENHAWNAVKIDSLWQVFDITWASPKNENGIVNEFYFNTKPERLISTHYPNDYKWTLLSEKYSKEEFINMPRVSDKLFEFGLSERIPNVRKEQNQIIIELSNSYDGDVGFILHEIGTYNSEIVEPSILESGDQRILKVQIPKDEKEYKLEMTYISKNPMLKHFELLTMKTKLPADNNR